METTGVRDDALPAIHSEPETASSARFFAFFRRLRSLSRCLALCISFFDRPGLSMSSSYTTPHYYFCGGR